MKENEPKSMSKSICERINKMSGLNGKSLSQNV